MFKDDLDAYQFESIETLFGKPFDLIIIVKIKISRSDSIIKLQMATSTCLFIGRMILVFVLKYDI